jgi:hypothetical protein
MALTGMHAQLQKDFKELQARLRMKEDECELYEKQCINLTEAFLQQGMNLPAEVPGSATAPAPAEDFGWGPDPVAKEVHNNGWGTIPTHASPPSPVSTLDGSHTGPSDSDNTYGWNNSSDVSTKNLSNLGPFYEKWRLHTLIYSYTQSELIFLQY